MTDPSLLVIGAGWGRTGTMSLKLALEKVYGEKCHHMKEVIQHGQFQLWSDVVHGKPDWGTIFCDYRTMVDFPGAAFYKELMQVYPEAKVILTVRDSGEAWYKSASETIIYDKIHGVDWALSVLKRLGKLGIGPRLDFIDGIYSKVGLSDDICRSQARAVVAYEEWNAEVQRVVPREKLLLFNVKEGWAPLCTFLGKPVPEGPFPRTNETADFLKQKAKLRFLTRAVVTGLTTVSGLSLALFVLAMRRLRLRVKL